MVIGEKMTRDLALKFLESIVRYHYGDFISPPWREKNNNDKIVEQLLQRGLIAKTEIDKCNRDCAEMFLDSEVFASAEPFISPPWREKNSTDEEVELVLKHGFLTQDDIDKCNKSCAKKYLEDQSYILGDEYGLIRSSYIHRVEKLANAGIYEREQDRVILGCLINNWIDAEDIVQHNRELSDASDYAPI